MIYVQFFGPSAIDKTKLIEGCGDRSVVILDGRNRRITHVEIAGAECKKRGWLAWQLHKGESFTRSKPITEIVKV